MTANELFERAIALLGYSNPNGDKAGLETLLARTVDCINQILSDISSDKKISALDEEIPVFGTGLEALIYGTAMLLALSISDNEKNVLFAGLYNIKRAAYKSSLTVRSDVLPFDDGGI